MKRDESKYVGDKSDKPKAVAVVWGRAGGGMVRAVLRTVIKGKRHSQKELEMISGSPLSCNPQY